MDARGPGRHRRGCDVRPASACRLSWQEALFAQAAVSGIIGLAFFALTSRRAANARVLSAVIAVGVVRGPSLDPDSILGGRFVRRRFPGSSGRRRLELRDYAEHERNLANDEILFDAGGQASRAWTDRSIGACRAALVWSGPLVVLFAALGAGALARVLTFPGRLTAIEAATGTARGQGRPLGLRCVHQLSSRRTRPVVRARCRGPRRTPGLPGRDRRARLPAQRGGGSGNGAVHPAEPLHAVHRQPQVHRERLLRRGSPRVDDARSERAAPPRGAAHLRARGASRMDARPGRHRFLDPAAFVDPYTRVFDLLRRDAAGAVGSPE